MKTEDLYKKGLMNWCLNLDAQLFTSRESVIVTISMSRMLFIENVAKTKLSVIIFPEKANLCDHDTVSCRYGRKRIGYVTTYDLEKYHILAKKNDIDYLSGHFGLHSANNED